MSRLGEMLHRRVSAILFLRMFDLDLTFRLEIRSLRRRRADGEYYPPQRVTILSILNIRNLQGRLNLHGAHYMMSVHRQ